VRCVLPLTVAQIDHEDDLLTISGENEIKKDETDKDKKWHRIERKFGSFKRQILLPQGVDQSTITASHKDGLLTITIPKPKQPEKKQSKIEVK
jgi:HSP20 family protein